MKASSSSDTAAALPPLYAGWLTALLGGPIPAETEATCSDCAMCARDGRPVDASPGEFFHPRIKCCTYLPELPNFLVGRILGDDDPAAARGRATVEARLDAGIGVSPLGLGRPATWGMLYQHATEVDAFGRTLSLRCPHYLEEEGGICGIWRHRYSVCATWFCKHVRGQVGAEFWRAVLQLLTAIEHDLTRWTLLELDIGADALRQMLDRFERAGPLAAREQRAELDGAVPRWLQRAMWGRWDGRARELFCASARLVDPLSWSDVLAICGSDVRAHARLTREAFAALRDEALPAALTAGPFKLVRAGRRTTRVEAYSPLDRVDLPNEVVNVLHFFTGRPTRASLDAIERTHGMRLDPALVRALADFRILVPPADRFDG